MGGCVKSVGRSLDWAEKARLPMEIGDTQNAVEGNSFPLGETKLF